MSPFGTMAAPGGGLIATIDLGSEGMTRVSLAPLAALAATAILLAGCVTAAVGAGATVGVAAAEERGVGGAATDTKIRATINALWMDRDIEMWRKLGLNVMEGRVLLTGKVDKPEQHEEAVRLAWRAESVKEVIDEIKVTSAGDIGNYARDVQISTELKSKLLLDKHVLSINYAVTTVDQVIYLLGIAQDQEERERVNNYARALPYVKKVVNHVILKDDPRRKPS